MDGLLSGVQEYDDVSIYGYPQNPFVFSFWILTEKDARLADMFLSWTR
jgi:hypothetical protein